MSISHQSSSDARNLILRRSRQHSIHRHHWNYRIDRIAFFVILGYTSCLFFWTTWYGWPQLNIQIIHEEHYQAAKGAEDESQWSAGVHPPETAAGTADGFIASKMKRDTAGPRLPQIDPLSPNFTNHFKLTTDNTEVHCNGEKVRVEPWVKVVNGSKIVFSLPEDVHGLIMCQVKELKTWKPLGSLETGLWPGKDMSHFASPFERADKKGAFSEPEFLKLENSDFALVNCTATLTKIALEMTTRMGWTGLLAGIHNPVHRKHKKVLLEQNFKEQDPPLDVLILVIDSLSRFNAENLMPQTVGFLRHHLDAAIFEHHTVVGENSLPNAAAMFTGFRPEELPLTGQSRLLEYPLIWKNFSKKGYMTAYFEDWPMTFSLGRTVDDHQVTATGIDNLGPVSGYIFYGNWSDKCSSGQPTFEFMKGLPEAMWTTYSNHPKFFLAYFTDYTHDDVRGSAYLDKPLKELLEGMHEKGNLDNTVTFIVGDHGTRFLKGFRDTTAGRIDHRTPFLAVVPPQKATKGTSGFTDDIWGTLRMNVDKLTSQFDIHATLWHILHLRGHRNKDEALAFPASGQSLLTHFSPARTCQEAKIPSFYCPYVDWTADSLNSALTLNLGYRSVDFINDYQNKFFKKRGIVSEQKMPCEKKKLRLDKIPPHGGILEKGRFYMNLFAGSGDFGMEFELSGTYEGDFKNVTFSPKEIFRLDKFGEPPECLRDFPDGEEKKFMNSICKCKRML